MEEILSKVLEFLTTAEGSAATIAVVLEFALRMVPSEKPLSILRMVSWGARAVGEVLVKFADLADKILPQKLKQVK